MVAEKIPCYIVNKNTGATVSFDVEIPETVNDSYVTNFQQQGTKGRSSPFKAYQNSGPRSITFTVTMALDLRRDLKETVDTLRDMLKPAKSSYIVAPRVRVRIGDVLNIEAVPTSFSVNWREGYKNNVYRVCDCEFAFDEVEDKGTFSGKTSGSYQTNTTVVRETNYNNLNIGSVNAQIQIGDYYSTSMDKPYYTTSYDAQDEVNAAGTASVTSECLVTAKYKDCIQIQVPEGGTTVSRWIKVN